MTTREVNDELNEIIDLLDIVSVTADQEKAISLLKNLQIVIAVEGINDNA
jgi:hypothetical protein